MVLVTTNGSGCINHLMTGSRLEGEGDLKTNGVASGQLPSEGNKQFKQEEIMQNYLLSIGWSPMLVTSHMLVGEV